MLLEEVARASAEVAAMPSRLGKIGRLAETVRRLRPEEAAVAVAYLSGELPQGTIGIGWASLRDLPGPASRSSLDLLEVDAALELIRTSVGRGSQAARRTLLENVFSRATETEQRYLRALLLGELRQGALAGVMAEAVAAAAKVGSAELRRAVMLAGELGPVAAAVLAHGRHGLADFRLTVLRPVQPMLANPAEDLPVALHRTGPAAVEWKLDGARLQVHRAGHEVRAFTRNLAEVTDRVPEIVSAVRALPVEAVILDGEAIALRPDGRPLPFQVTMSRFGSRLDAERQRATVPLSGLFFDCLHLDGQDLLDLPLRERFPHFARHVPEHLRVPRTEAASLEQAAGVLEDALRLGHEGVLVKALDAPYEAGRRGRGWLKVKRATTLDLVVLGAEWGHGRRRGWLSNLHLGARDPRTGGYVMLGKTFKGLTDQMLEWQTSALLALETGREGYTVYVRPELIVEVAFDGVQASPRYPGGVALRFARVKGYRPDKRAADADTIDAVLVQLGGASARP